MERIKQPALCELALPVKTLFTGFLLTIGLGLLMAGAQIMLTHGMADGKAGLSVDDIVYSYYGDRSGSTLESKLNGSMKNNAPPEVRLEMIKWVKAGAPEKEWESTIKPHVEKYCAMCHANMPGLVNISNKDEMYKMTTTSHGATISTLARVSHIHLFGISFIFFFVGWIFTYANGFSKMIKVILILTPFGFLILDVAAWWLTKLNPAFAWLVMFGGFGYSVAATVMIFSSLYQLWFKDCKLQID